MWSTHRRQLVPAWLGWTLLAWSLPFVTALPRSPSWTVPVIGALVVAGDRGRVDVIRSRTIEPGIPEP